MTTRPIPQIIAELADADPDAPAITCGEATYTRRDIDQLSTALAHQMRGRGLGRGDFVTIALPNGVEFYVATIAAWKVGAVPQPISWRLPVRERDAILELAAPKLVIGPGAYAGLPSIEVELTGLDRDLPRLSTVASPAWKASTSGGSTGRPKLILSGTSAQFDPEVVAGQALIGRDQKQLVAGPLYHNSPLTYSVLGYLVGHHLVVLPRFDAGAALDAITQFSINFAVLVPTMMSRMLRAYRTDPDRYNLDSLQTVWHLAAPCPPWLKEAWIELVGPERLWEVYTGTELQAVTVISGAEWIEHRGSVGRVVSGEMKIIDDAGTELPAGQVGEIYMRSDPGNPPTYQYIGADVRGLEGGWESLGDMGWFDADGYLYLSDRRADMVLVGGANIYPAEVEGALDEHPAVVSSVVVGLPDEDLGSRLHAVVQISEPIGEEDLRAFLADRLETRKQPRSYRLVTEPLHDDAGKVNRSAIRDAEVSASAAKTPREVLLALLEGTVANDPEQGYQLWDEHAVMEWPFATGGHPRRIEGRERIRAHRRTRTAALGDLFISAEYHHQHWFTCEDPELVALETTLITELRDIGIVERRYIYVVRVRDGKVVLFTDYADNTMPREVIDRLPHLFPDLAKSGADPGSFDPTGQ